MRAVSERAPGSAAGRGPDTTTYGILTPPVSKTPDTPTEDRDTMRPEYDFSGAVRSVTARRYAQGANVVVSPDLLDVFPDGKSVDEALRALAPILRRTNPPSGTS